MARDKHRIRFQKAGTLRLVSHHDLKRCFERMLRRAALPFASTEGFHPQPRIVFGLSLALGLVGRDEVADLLLTEEMDPEQVHERLARQAPPGLDILRVERVDPRARILARLATYSLHLSPERRAGLAERAAELLAQPELWYERTRPQPRRVNVRPYLSAVRVGPDAVEIDITVTPTGTARPEEVFALLGLADVLEAGAVMERTRLELHDGPSPANGAAPAGDAVDEPPQDFFADSEHEPLQDDTIPPPASSGAAPPRG
jgi:radical SAM-linked protein